MSAKPDKWIVCAKGDQALSHGFELSIVKRSNTHGQQSYGWPRSDEKIIILESGHFTSHDLIGQPLWKAAIQVANDAARQLNEGKTFFEVFHKPKHY